MFFMCINIHLLVQNEAGNNVMSIDEAKFYKLWNEYFYSSDMNADGNYLLGFIDWISKQFC